MPQDTNIITDAKNNIDLACSSTFRRIKPRPKRGLSSFDCSGNLIHRSPPLLIKSQEHVATPSESQCPSQRDALVIDLNLFSSVRDHIIIPHTGQSVTARNCGPTGWARGRTLYSHPPLAPRELPWTQSAETYCLIPCVA